jgi:nitrogen-specific signal transduction histidine kinase
MVLAVCVSAIFVFALSFLLINISLQTTTQSRLDGITDLIAKNDGEFPARAQYETLENGDQLFMFDFSEESPYRLRYFTVFLEDNGDYRVSSDHIASVTVDKAIWMTDAVLQEPSDVGYYENYRYYKSNVPHCVVFLDCSYELENIENVMKIVAFVAAVFVILIVIVFGMFSGTVVKPFEDNALAQRQFITDASHELKTPVAIISANAEVLAYKDGDSEWVQSIIEQTKRMSELINEMLALSRLEETDGKSTVTAPTNMTKLVESGIKDFDEVFSNRNITVESKINPNITINANEPQMKRLVSIILENASKYADENGTVRISLRRSVKNIVFSVFNSCDVSPDLDYEHLFDRFYRPDSSRASSTGGHGIGLSIAKRICELHGGTITAKPSDDGITFTAIISAKIRPNAPNKDE